MGVTISGTTVELHVGDIAEQHVDAIVSTGNPGLFGGEGVDGALHRAAGPELMNACREIGRCEPGSAVVTSAFALSSNGVQHIVHAVGPSYRGGDEGEADILAAAFSAALEQARSVGAKRVALPAISTGGYGFPPPEAAPVAVAAIRAFLGRNPACFERLVIVVHEDTEPAFTAALA